MAPSFKPFKLALIQLGNITANKVENIKHAREMILKAATTTNKPDLIVLPVRVSCPVFVRGRLTGTLGMLQLALRSYAFPSLCGEDRIHGQILQCRTVGERKCVSERLVQVAKTQQVGRCEDALQCCERNQDLAYRRKVTNTKNIPSSHDRTGTIPERDGENLYNTCTVYNPDGMV